eukprot:scaffold32733_cov65-Phaeocystis_antarctica.AAC.2
MVEEIEAVELTAVEAHDVQFAVPVAAAGGAPTQTDQARVIELEGENNDLRRRLADLLRPAATPLSTRRSSKPKSTGPTSRSTGPAASSAAASSSWSSSHWW